VPRFRKKPEEIDAIQFTGSNVEEIWAMFGHAGIQGPGGERSYLILETFDNPVPAVAGDWIVPGSKPNTFSAVKPDDFEARYELIEVVDKKAKTKG